MRVVLLGAELEENLGLRYLASSLEREGHEAEIVGFDSEEELARAVEQVIAIDPEITGLSMVFTGRAREFCRLAGALREAGYTGHIIAGGHFASFNCERLLKDFPAFDSVALGEGEQIICSLARHLDEPGVVQGLAFRREDGSVQVNPSAGNPDDLDALPFPKRIKFHDYFGTPIASVLTSRGCWRDCAFCSINAWYKRGGGKKFRIRSIENIVAELSELYFNHGVRIFNFQDDNFFVPNAARALERFEALQDGLARKDFGPMAIAVKARPDSITRETIGVLDELGLFRVFLGVENASVHGLQGLHRQCELHTIYDSLQILNDFDIHVAFNLLMFEPDTVMDDILTNLRFIERHLDNPFNFCRAEAYAGTGLEDKLVREGRLLGDYFGFDYRLKDPRSEAFHHIANFAFFDRNFGDYGLHYFNMQVDFYFQLLRRFHPECLTQSLRAASRSFIKRTNLDTYELLSEIYDFVVAIDPADQLLIRAFAKEMRTRVDAHSQALYVEGERILRLIEGAYAQRGQGRAAAQLAQGEMPAFGCLAQPYAGIEQLEAAGTAQRPIPYPEFKRRLEEAAGS